MNDQLELARTAAANCTGPADAKQSKRSAHRPSAYTRACAERICCFIATGVPLTEIVRQDGMPGLATVYRWLARKDRGDFRDMYARARADLAHTFVSEIIEIADDSRNDWVERNGERVVDNEAVQRSRLRVDARKWVAAKLLPKVYGDRVEQVMSGPDGRAVTLQVESKVQARLAEGLAALRAKLPANEG